MNEVSERHKRKQDMKDRSWAKGLSQEDFKISFMQRCPRADSIPLVADYLSKVPKEGHGIDPFNEEQMSATDVMRPEKMPQGLDKMTCCGCYRKFTAQIGRISHERKCEKALQIPIEIRKQPRAK